MHYTTVSLVRPNGIVSGSPAFGRTIRTYAALFGRLAGVHVLVSLTVGLAAGRLGVVSCYDMFWQGCAVNERLCIHISCAHFGVIQMEGLGSERKDIER
jgi:hypothetical protein